MSADDNKLLVRRFYEEVVATGDCGRLEEFVSPALEVVYQNTRYPAGLAGAKEHVLGVRQTYADFELTVDRQIAEGDWVATCVTMRGTHCGVWLGMKPTGARIEMTGVNIDRVLHGRIVEHGGAANTLEPLLEIGAVRIGDPTDT